MILVKTPILCYDNSRKGGYQMYKYHYCITTSKKMDNFLNYDEQIMLCVETYNRKSEHSRNYKHISTCNIKKDTIEFNFLSQNDLGDCPSLKPLWLFSRSMLSISGLQKYCVDKRFLKLMNVKRISMEDENVILTDKDVLKNLIDIYMVEHKASPYMNKLRAEIKEDINAIIMRYINNKES